MIHVSENRFAENGLKEFVFISFYSLTQLFNYSYKVGMDLRIIQLTELYKFYMQFII